VDGKFRQTSERFSYLRALIDAHRARPSSRHLDFTRARVHARTGSGSLVRGSEDGSDSFDSLVAKSNAQPLQLVAQLAHVVAHVVRTSYGCFPSMTGS